MSGSSRAHIDGTGWQLLLDSGLSISWARPTDGAAIHRREEDEFRARMNAGRARLERLVRDSGLVLGDPDANVDVDGAALPAALTFPMRLLVRTRGHPQCSVRLFLQSGARDDVVRFVDTVRPLLDEIADHSAPLRRLKRGPIMLCVLGAGGGLGRNVVDAGLAAGHRVRALVRDAARANLPSAVAVVVGDANDSADVARAADGACAVAFCVNPPLSTWAMTFPPLLEATLTALRPTSSTLLFPANVWIYGRGGGGHTDERASPAPTSSRGRLRLAMEQRIQQSGVRARRLRLPEFYGEHVVTLTAHAIQKVLQNERVWWPGDADAVVEFVYLRDAAAALVALAALGDDVRDDLFHLPGTVTTPRGFMAEVSRAAGVTARITSVPTPLLRLAARFDATVAAVADIGHLWTHPILLDGRRYQEKVGALPQTSLSTALAATVAWHRANPSLKLQG